MDRIRTTCVYCASGCQLDLILDNSEVVAVSPVDNDPVSRGKLCPKGLSVHEFIYHPDRLKKPLVKRDGEFREVGWDEALDLVCTRLKQIKENFGSNSIGVLGSGKCSNEDNFLVSKFTRAVLGTNNIDNCARLCHSSTTAGLMASFGAGSMTNSIDEIEKSDVIMLFGSNTTEQHPAIAMRIEKAVEESAKLIVVDPRRVPISSLSALHFRIKPGTDVVLINSFMNVILEEGLHDTEFIENRTDGFEQLAKAVSKYSPEYVEGIIGVPAAQIRAGARAYAKAERASIAYAMGITQHTSGTNNVISLANLALLTGNVGKEATGIYPLRGQANVQGAGDMGALPNVYTGAQSIADERVREKFERRWKTNLSPDVGMNTFKMFQAALDKRLKAMFIMGENPMLSVPDIANVRKALQSLDLLVVQDTFLSETAEEAHVVLPACSFAEKDGTFTSMERKVHRIRKAIEPLYDSKPDWAIISEIARRMGYTMDYNSPEEIMHEVAELTPNYGGISYARLDVSGLQWPCPNADHPGTKYLHKDRFPRGKAKFNSIEFTPPDEPVDENYPFLLITGRNRYHSNTGTMTRRSETLYSRSPQSHIEVNPVDAMKVNLSEGEMVKVSSRRGDLITRVLVTDSVQEGTCFMPFHFPEAAVNLVTNPALDPIANIPAFKGSAVKIEKTH